MNKISMQTKLIVASAVSAVAGAVMALAANAQSVPTVGTSDIAAVGAPILTAFIGGTEYTLETFGPPLFWILLAIAVFFAIYHRVKVGHWL
jgi:hypothetical protein